jgi:chromosome segregation ATPase
MVQTDISQTTAECADWRQALRNYRDEFSHDKKELESLCRSTLSKDQLHQVEHFHNQFHIQLINIHDLKQTIKAHERQLQFQPTPSEELLAQHEDLYDRFSSMQAMLQELRNEFSKFRSQVV